MNSELRKYIEDHILPRYAAFDKGHQRDHAESVINESLKLAKEYQADTDMAYTIAAYHDLGLSIDRPLHHIRSGEILQADEHLRQWFSEQQITTMREAVEDHRASSKNPPRSIYGAIVAEADRQLDPQTVIRRTLQYGLKQNPTADFEWHLARTCEHLQEKYGEGGYMHLWLKSERNLHNLETLHQLLKQPQTLREIALRIWQEEIK
ncbi:MAG: HD domain-containing protein [Paludibacteraceae bacterium]|nr:HD domain-containing protein [Paludibacteraceae bacterium]